jgi:hypothetical protein
MDKVVWILIGLLVGYGVGWRAAHITVATECRRLGGFFVGGSIFKCVEIKDPKPFVIGLPIPPNPYNKKDK